MFGRFAGEEQGDAVKGVLATNNPSKRMADPFGSREAGGLSRVGRFAYVVGADFLIDAESQPFPPWALELLCSEDEPVLDSAASNTA